MLRRRRSGGGGEVEEEKRRGGWASYASGAGVRRGGRGERKQVRRGLESEEGLDEEERRCAPLCRRAK